MTRAGAIAAGAALLTVAIWANFLVTTCGVVGAGLGLAEMALLRAVVSTVGLAPILWTTGLYPKGLPVWRFAVMVAGAAASFMILIPGGFVFAPPAASGVFAPGVLPLWVAILALIFLGERMGLLRAFGFALIAAGVFGVGGWEAISGADEDDWIGFVMFSSGSLTFAFYTIAQRGSGLTALQATALISAWSLPIAIVWALIDGVDFTTVTPLALGWTALAQFGSGVVAIVSYTYAIMHLGPSRGAAFIALTPVAVALASDIFLGQPATPLVWLGIAVVSLGVLIASGALSRARAEEAETPPREGNSAPLVSPELVVAPTAEDRSAMTEDMIGQTARSESRDV